MAKQKFYVVWKGRQTGIFDSWEDCNAQIFQFPKAVYKSFKTRQLAEQAFKSSWWEYISKDIFELIDRAVKWLNENEYENEVLKWETRAWGENPADFGRK